MQKQSPLAETLYSYAYYLALVPALVATLGSLYLSEVAQFIPCTYCWYQRILMYPLVVLIIVGIVKGDELLPNYVLPLSIMGIFMSTYHYLTQWGIFSESTACTAGTPCSMRYINWLGFITIPAMAWIAFVAITVLMLGFVWAGRQLEDEEEG